jgi:hypothetical protein
VNWLGPLSAGPVPTLGYTYGLALANMRLGANQSSHTAMY